VLYIACLYMHTEDESSDIISPMCAAVDMIGRNHV